MPTINQIISEEWTDDLTGLGGTDFYSGLNGNQDEIIQLTLQVRTLTYYELSEYELQLDTINNVGSIFAGSGLSMFNVGDTFRVVADNAPNEDRTGTITSASDAWIIFDYTTWVGTEGTKENDVIYLTTQINDIEFEYGLYNTSIQFTSYLDGQPQSYRLEGIDHSTFNVVNGVAQGKNWNNGSVTCQFVQTSGSPLSNSGNWTDLAQDFEIIHIFRTQTYNESLRDEILENTIPFEYKGSSTYNYAANIKYYTSLENANSVKEQSFTSLGNVGWYNEIFNGIADTRQIQDVTFTRDSNGDEVEGLISTERTNFSFTITNAANNELVIRHKKLAFEEDYTIDDSYDNIFYSSDLNVPYATLVSGGYFYNVETVNSGSDLIVTGSFEVGDSDLNEEAYLLSVSVQSDKSDRNNLTVSAADYVYEFDIEGLIGTPTHDLFLRDCTDFSIDGATSFSMIKAEIITFKIVIPVLDGTIESIELQTIALDGDDVYVVDTTTLDTSGFVTVDGVQEINETLPNPYNISMLDGSISHLGSGEYEIIYPYMMPYDEEIPVSNLPDVLFNNTLPNNGKNEDTFYIQQQGLNIHIAYRIGMLKDNVLTYYRYRTPRIVINNFEQALP